MSRRDPGPSRRKGNFSSQSGFTLLEVLIIMVVIGILAATIIVAISGVNTESARAACDADAKTVEQAVVAFRDNPNNDVDAGQYPAPGSAGQSELIAPASSSYGGPYLRSWPNNPHHYTITLDSVSMGQVDVTPAGSPTPMKFDGTIDPCSIVP